MCKTIQYSAFLTNRNVVVPDECEQFKASESLSFSSMLEPSPAVHNAEHFSVLINPMLTKIYKYWNGACGICWEEM